MRVSHSAALILVHHGASTVESVNGYHQLKNGVKNYLIDHIGDLLIEEAFINQRYTENKSVTILDLESILGNLLANNIQSVYLQPSLLVPGQQYHKLIQILEVWKDKFKKMVIGDALLSDIESCKQLSILVNDYFTSSIEMKKILVAHGGVNQGNKWLSIFNNELCKINSQFQLVELSRSENFQELGNILKSKIINCSQVQIIPFMLILGHHFYSDIVLASQTIDRNIKIDVFHHGLSELPFLHSFICYKIKQLFDFKHIYNSFSQ